MIKGWKIKKKQSGQSLTERAGEDTQSTGLRNTGETNYTQYDPSGCVGIMQTQPYAMNLCLWRTISHISCCPLFTRYLFFHNTGLYNYIVPVCSNGEQRTKIFESIHSKQCSTYVTNLQCTITSKQTHKSAANCTYHFLHVSVSHYYHKGITHTYPD
jgi:hypothetical protein